MLTQLQITNAKPKEKPYTLSDSRGLHLYVHNSGSKLWRIRYRFAGKANMLSLGAFPEVSIADARKRRDQIKDQISQGIDPSIKRKVEKAQAIEAKENTFGKLAEDYLKKLEADGKAENTLGKNRWLLVTVAAPLKNRPVGEITPAEILQLLKKVEGRGNRETAHRLRGVIGSVFRFGIANLRAETDPTSALRGSLLKRHVKHRAAITEEKELGIFWAQLETYEGWKILNAAFRFLILTIVRPGEVRYMRKPELNFDKKVWSIPGDRMKMRRPFDVPLSRQALAVLKEVWDDTPEDGLVFPSLRSAEKPLSENSFISVLRHMGYPKEVVTAHGFRSSASTVLNERGYDPDHIEAALAHEDENEVRRAYNRAKYWKQRVALMQDWADLLDGLKPRLRLVASNDS